MRRAIGDKPLEGRQKAAPALRAGMKPEDGSDATPAPIRAAAASPAKRWNLIGLGARRAGPPSDLSRRLQGDQPPVWHRVVRRVHSSARTNTSIARLYTASIWC